MSQAECAPSTGDLCVAPGNLPLATNDVSSSRRGLLAGLMLAPALCATLASPALAQSGRWVQAMRALDTAKSLDAAYTARADWADDQTCDESDRLTDAVCRAEDALIDCPAPHLPAVIWKIEYARDRWKYFDDWPAEWWAAILSDLRRLAALAPNGAVAS